MLIGILDVIHFLAGDGLVTTLIQAGAGEAITDTHTTIMAFMVEVMRIHLEDHMVILDTDHTIDDQVYPDLLMLIGDQTTDTIHLEQEIATTKTTQQDLEDLQQQLLDQKLLLDREQQHLLDHVQKLLLDREQQRLLGHVQKLLLDREQQRLLGREQPDQEAIIALDQIIKVDVQTIRQIIDHLLIQQEDLLQETHLVVAEEDLKKKQIKPTF